MCCECETLKFQVANLQTQVDSLLVNVDGVRVDGRVVSPGLQQRVRQMEKRFDTGDSPGWKRLLFRFDGWGPWFQLRKKPRWRPWRMWWTS